MTLSHSAGCQHTINFEIPSTVCVGQNLYISNGSDVGVASWDFCLSLEGSYSSDSFARVAPSLAGLSILEHNGNWFGFALTQDSRLFRIEFGSNPVNNNFTIIQIGNTGSLLSNPDWIDVIESNGKWYGLITNQSNELVKLVWNDLKAEPQAISLNLKNSGKLKNPTQVEIKKDGNDYVAIVANADSRQLALINFGSSMDNIPVTNDIILSPALDGASNMYGVTAVQECGNWVIYTSVTNRLYKVNIGAQLFSFMNQDQITEFTSDIPIQVGSYIRMRSAVEGGDTYVYFSSYTGNIVSAFVWRQGASKAEFIDLTQLANPGQLYSMALVKHNQTYKLFVGSFGSGLLYIIQPVFSCASSVPISNSFSPQGIYFTKPGIYSVYLKMTFTDGVQCGIHKQISVTSLQAPDISIDYLNKCVNSDVFFTAKSASIISAYSWSFGDSQSASLANPTHQFTSAGSYKILLELIAVNGCHNRQEQLIQIYEPPVSNFVLPSGSICTNNEFTFSNSTLDNFDGNLTYAWFVNDELKAASRDFNYAFSSEGDQQIKLRTTIPGCSNENTKTLLNLQTGPVVGFSFTGKCENELIRFTNLSSGSISSFQWNFGNGHTSTIENPTEAYAAHGNYSVSLNTTGTNGCVSTITKPVTIYTVPQTNFALDLPPFSCTGSPSQFNDLTPSMSDSNITSWAWAFGDQANGTSSQKNPVYTYSLAGNYLASLTTTSNFGCSNSIQKTITIYPSPKADFSFKNACVDQRSEFTDLSTGDIKSWVWTIQSSTYSVKNPIHIFKSASNHTALLTVTGTNNCVSQISKTITVPVPVVVDFTATSTCADKPTEFKAATISGLDLPVAWSWDFGDQGNGSGNNATHTYAATGSYAVKLNATRQSGCTYSVTNSVDIVEPPKANFTVFLQSGPPPFSVDLTNLSSQATQYVWKPGDPKQANTSAYSPSFTYTELGDYLIELEATNDASGCRDNMQQLIHVVIPKMNAAVSDFKLNKISGSDQWRSVVTIENKSNVALIDPEVYLDISGNAKISEKVVGVIKPNESLTHTFNAMIVPQSVDFACAEVRIDSDTNLFDNRACVNVAEQTISFSPYPNPAYDELILEWINITNAPMEVTIYQATGQVIFSRQYAPTLAGLNQANLDVSTLPNGIYFVTYSVNGQAQNFKFSVAR